MGRKTWAFTLAALLLSLGLAAFVSPFASSAPDGLDRVAQDRKFEEKAEGAAVWTRAPCADYKVQGVSSASISTGLAGAAGTLLVFACAMGLARAVARKRQ